MAQMTTADVIGQFLMDLDGDRASAAQLPVQQPSTEIGGEEAPEEPVVLVPSIVTYRRFKK